VTFDELVSAVRADRTPTPGSHGIELTVSTTLRHLGLTVNEADGTIVVTSVASALKDWQPPSQRNVRFTGSGRKRRR
jgi:hypothetical protein